LRSQTGLPRAAVIERMIDTFRRSHGLRADTLTTDELDRAQVLAREKFDTAEWTAAVP